MPPSKKTAARKPAQAAPISTTEIRKRLTAFSHNWQGGKDEKADAQTFTLRLLECYGLNEHHYLREGRVPKLGGATGFMDGFIPGKLIIEFKSLGKNLKKAAEQAMGYHWGLPPEQQPTHILLCDFQTFVLVDLARQAETIWELQDLPRHADRLRFLIDDSDHAILEERDADRRAAYQLAQLHESLLRVNFTGKPLEVFLTRTLFCLFADDTGMLGENGKFLRFLQGSRGDGDDLGPRIQKLFETLNKPEAKRQTNLDDAYRNFPYVNGSLFADPSEVPSFDSDLRQTLIACAELDWKDISPAIFGAMFQGVLEGDAGDGKTKASKAKRRDLGAHYTSERNILRAINPLFMDALRAEFAAAGSNKAKLQALLDRLPTIHLFDPACGCGNFLVIAYRELRLLELAIIEKLHKPKDSRQTALLELADLARVSPDQLHGIEIEDSAAHIARVAILITDHQINEQSRHIGQPRPTIPLGKMPNIVCANALTTDWASVIPPERCTYIVGNPPFLGKKEQSPAQKADFQSVMGHIDGAGVLDFVAAWYVKATRYMQANSEVRAALVSTNSITQGEQVGVLWSWLLAQCVHIQFAHRTFRWTNEGKGIAAVHCVIIGFGLGDVDQKTLFDYSDIKGEPLAVAAKNINPYLLDAPAILIAARKVAICSVPEVTYGSFALDDGNFTIDVSEREKLIEEDSRVAGCLRPFIGGEELLHGTPRWCLWLQGVNPSSLRSISSILKKIEAVRVWRKASSRAATNRLADTPAKFAEIRQPLSRYIAIPTVSSERRNFIPIALLEPEVVASNQLYVVAGAMPFHFGILSSTMHNAWMRTVCGRMKSDYRYSAAIVYNNYPWPDLPASPEPRTPPHKAKAAIEAAAQAVLDARAQFQQGETPSSLADLYDPLTMPPDLRKAHQQLDKAVDAAYGYKGGKDDASRVAFLFERYQVITGA
ncbi:MAG: N-6 DNA methylase [Rhodocyclaceae bacterium]|nr:N-6 DNA methylase [Rhodocyclaceae bacterium]